MRQARTRWSQRLGVIVVLSLLLCLSSPTTVWANPIPKIIRVTPTGSDIEGCGTEATPCRTLQFAVDQAENIDEVRVAEGTYTYNAAADHCTASPAATGVVCILNRELTLRGGYSSNDWSEPDPESHQTIIDGEDTHRGLLVLSTGTPTRLEMEGFIVQNGRGNAIWTRLGDDAIFGFGGGLFADMGAETLVEGKIILRDVVFRNNLALGADTSNPYGGSGVGGGVALRSVGSAFLEYVRFEGNEARSGVGSIRSGYAIGGGLYAERSYVHARHVVFESNAATVPDCDGSGIASGRGDALGGGVASQGREMTLQYITATNNWARGGNTTQYPGRGFGGGVFGENTTLTILDSWIAGNTAEGGNSANGGIGAGGGIDAHNSTITVHRSHVFNNQAKAGNSISGGNSGSPGGGGLYLVRLNGEATADIANSVIAGNALEFGTGRTNVGGGGGGIWLQGIETNIRHSTIADNDLIGTPMQGDALLVLSRETTPQSVLVEFSIIANHTSGNGVAAVYAQVNNTIHLRRTLWSCNYRNHNGGLGAGTIIDQDPLDICPAWFVDPGPPAFDYHLLRASPARDAAVGSSETMDMDSEERPIEEPRDIGADECLPPPLSLGVHREANDSLLLHWIVRPDVSARADHYGVVVSCPPGAAPPAQGACGEPIAASSDTRMTLTGLTAGAEYTLRVEAHDGSCSPLAASAPVTMAPRTVSLTFLPITTR